MPTISVIIPNYNHALYLRKRIESILNQTYQDFEIIIMDDYSQDNSLEIIHEFQNHPKVAKILINQVNGGSTFKQWNHGINEASGEYVWIAESDDYADSTFLERLHTCARRHPSSGIIYCESWVIDENNITLNKASEWSLSTGNSRWQNDFFNTGVQECSDYLVSQNTIPNASAVIFKKSIYEKAGDADISMRLAGDWLQWAKMLLISDIVFVAEPLNYYRTHTGTVRKNASILVREVLECHQVISFIASATNAKSEQIELAHTILLDRWLCRMITDYSKPLKECYAELHTILEKTKIPDKCKEYIFEKLLREWVVKIGSNQMSFVDSIRTYKIAKEVDRFVLSKLIKRIIKYYKRKQ